MSSNIAVNNDEDEGTQIIHFDPENKKTPEPKARDYNQEYQRRKELRALREEKARKNAERKLRMENKKKGIMPDQTTVQSTDTKKSPNALNTSNIEEAKVLETTKNNSDEPKSPTQVNTTDITSDTSQFKEVQDIDKDENKSSHQSMRDKYKSLLDNDTKRQIKKEELGKDNQDIEGDDEDEDEEEDTSRVIEPGEKQDSKVVGRNGDALMLLAGLIMPIFASLAVRLISRGKKKAAA